MGRMEKVNNQVKREIGMIISRELSDPRLQFVTITGVDVSKDLRTARVFFTVLGDEKSLENAQNSLNGASAMIRRELGRRIVLRYLPQLTFLYDKGLEKELRIEQAIEDIQNESKNV